jgi:hypothetical protein
VGDSSAKTSPETSPSGTGTRAEESSAPYLTRDAMHWRAQSARLADLAVDIAESSRERQDLEQARRCVATAYDHARDSEVVEVVERYERMAAQVTGKRPVRRPTAAANSGEADVH